MKIGELAKRTGVSRDTLRFYIKEGLLLPSRNGKQLEFGAGDVADVAFIRELKNLEFSLRDIRSLLTTRRLANEKDAQYLIKYQTMLQAQRERLNREIQTLYNKKGLVETRIQTLGGIPARESSGVPLAALPLLACPLCGASLHIERAEIGARGVTSGHLVCACGYQTEILDGILLTPNVPTTIYDRPDLDRSLHMKMWPDVADLHERTYETITAHLKELGMAGKVCLETNINNAFYFYSHMKNVAGARLLIVTDKYRETLRMCKDCLDQMDPPVEILYLADESTRFPLRSGCVDVFVDCMACNSHDLYAHTFLPAEIRRFLKPGGVAVGVCVYFDPGAKSADNIQTAYPEGTKEYLFLASFRRALTAAYERTVVEKVGSVKKTMPGRYTFGCHVDGEDWNTASYIGFRPADGDPT